MCGIFGYLKKDGADFIDIQKPFETLIYSAHSRGKEASGLASLSYNQQVTFIKSDLDSKSFLKSREYAAFVKALSPQRIFTVIGHSRLATHGSQLVHENNQPVVSAGKDLIGVHNGIITNPSYLWQSMMNTGEIPMLDSQVLFDYIAIQSKKFSLLQAVAKTYYALEGSASIALLYPETETLLLATNTGSLYYYTDKRIDTLFFASERVFLENAFPEAAVCEITQLKPMTALQVTRKAEAIFTLTDNGQIGSAVREISAAQLESKTQFTDCSVAGKKSSAVLHYNVANNMAALKKHDFDYKRIYALRRCKRCVLPSSTPFISFNSDGVCSYCTDHQQISHKTEDQLEQIIRKYRKGNGQPDCLAAFSGGRDSSYGLHYLKKELGLQPLAYTYDWGMVTDIARRNQARMLGQLGIEHILLSADVTTKRKHINLHIRAWMKKPHLGMVPLFMEGDKQCEFYADQIMKKYKLDLMFFFRGNELEKDEFKTGQAGVKDADPGGVIHNLAPMNKLKLFSFYASQYLSNPAYINSSVFDTALGFFSTYIQKHNYVYLWHYVPWREEKILDTLINQYGWETPTETTATWRTDDGTSAFYNYIYYQVQGFTENDSMRSRQIREGLLTREKALAMVHEENKPRYESLLWYFDMVALNGDEVLTVVDNMPKQY